MAADRRRDDGPEAGAAGVFDRGDRLASDYGVLRNGNSLRFGREPSSLAGVPSPPIVYLYPFHAAAMFVDTLTAGGGKW